MSKILKFHFITSMTIARHLKYTVDPEKYVKLIIHLMGVTSYDTHQMAHHQNNPIVANVTKKSKNHCGNSGIGFSGGFENIFL